MEIYHSKMHVNKFYYTVQITHNLNDTRVSNACVPHLQKQKRRVAVCGIKPLVYTRVHASTRM